MAKTTKKATTQNEESDWWNDRFYRLSGFVIAVGILIIIVLAVLASGAGLHVREVSILGTSTAGELTSQRVRFKFNRPLNRDQDLASLVKVEPDSEVSVVGLASELVVSFKQNLRSDTEYKISISSELYDIYNEKLGSEYLYDFKTRSLNLLYIDNSDPGGTARIMQLSDIELGTPEELYAEKNITGYSKKGDYLAVIVQINRDIRILKLHKISSGETIELTSSDRNVYSVTFSPVSNELIVLSERVMETEGYVVSDGGRGLQIYNIESKEFYPVSLPDDIVDIDEVVVSGDGRALLVKNTLDSVYYLLDVNDTSSMIPMGRFNYTGGFNFTGDAAIFTRLDPLADSGNPYALIVNAERETIVVTNGSNFVTDSVFLNTSDGILLSQKYEGLEFTRGLFEVVLMQSDKTFRVEGESLELAKPSPDDRYFVAESYSAEDLSDFTNLRILGSQAKPRFARLILFDIATGAQLSKSFQGIEASWE